MTLDELPKPPTKCVGWPWTEASEALLEKMPNGSDWPSVSIVTPSYNQGEYLEETIRSVLLQSYPNIQYIIIDGGSIDGSVEIIKKYEPWISYWVSEADKGQTDAINKGFRAATGQILGYLNSDDVYTRSALSNLLSKVYMSKKNNQVLLAGAVKDFGTECVEKIHSNAVFGSVDQWLDGGVSLHQPGCLWSREMWELYGPFRTDLHFIFDRYFFAMCRIHGAKLLSTTAHVALFRLHKESKTTHGYIENNNFSIEWGSVKNDLEEQLNVVQKIALKYKRNLNENWRLVSLALNSCPGSMARKRLYGKLLRNPLWVFHRPVAGAISRILMEKFISQ